MLNINVKKFIHILEIILIEQMKYILYTTS